MATEFKIPYLFETFIIYIIDLFSNGDFCEHVNFKFVII